MPMQDAIDLARYLAETTIGFIKYSVLLPAPRDRGNSQARRFSMDPTRGYFGQPLERAGRKMCQHLRDFSVHRSKPSTLQEHRSRSRSWQHRGNGIIVVVENKFRYPNGGDLNAL
jgi:hypothetical protein